MFLRMLMVAAFVLPGAANAQSPGPCTASRPAILGGLEEGKYSNPKIGFEIELDRACTFVDEVRAIAWSTQFSERLNAALRCGDNLYLLSSFPLHADETTNLKRDAGVSLQGVMDGGGFKKHGGWETRTVSGTEVLVQELSRRGESGQEVGFYHAFMAGRRYVSILAIGPEGKKAELGQTTAKVRIKPA